jgi:alpha-tubulin suppressor-like RCC1 family protein
MTNSPTPIQVVGPGGFGFLSSVKSIATAYSHTVALKVEGTVWAWGENWTGELGDGTTTDSPTPVEVRGPGGSGFLTDVQGITAGQRHTVALKTDGTVWTWGGNYLGELSATPVQVIDAGGAGFLGGIHAVEAGAWHTVAVKSDGTAWAWGHNNCAQLGDGTMATREAPVQITGPSWSWWLGGIQAVAAADFHSVALRTDGTVWTWGENRYGQLGNGTMSDSAVPVPVKGPEGVGFLTEVQAIEGGSYMSLALKTDGTIRAWGRDTLGQLGDGPTGGVDTLVQVIDPDSPGPLADVQAIAAGMYHAMALKTDGTVWAWGYNDSGQIGDGTLTNSPTPVQVLGPGGSGFLAGVQGIAGGGRHSIALKADGTVWAWGSNQYGKLGDGAATDSVTPVQVVGPGGAGSLAGVQAVDAGGDYAMALGTDGTVWAWGGNWLGQLGSGTTDNSSTPVQVVGPGGVGFLTDVKMIAAGSYHAVALKTDGTVWAWGANWTGQLGDGTTADSTMPVQVLGPGGSGFLADVEDIAAGHSHTVALKADSTVWAWGANWDGRLGDRTRILSTTPVQVLGPGGEGFLRGVTAIAAGTDHTVALVP